MKTLMEKLEWFLELGGIKKDISLLCISGITLIVSIFNLLPLPFDAAWIAVVLCGIPIILEAVYGLVTAFDIKADVLVSLALIASICIGEIFAAGEVAFIMQLGALLEDLTVARARAGIERLVHLTPQTARVLRSGSETVIPAEDVQVGDILRVLPGETVPVDGIITAGQTSVNQAVMTGESLPVDKTVGDEVSSGTANQFGAFEMKATKVGEDSSIQRMIRLVQSADAGKAKIVSLADRWATWIVVIALAAALVVGLVTGEVIRGVTVLVVFCPCSLVLATPTAIMAAIGNVTKYGFLVREGDALERLAAVSKVTFDKTGTLTYGTPKVIDVKSLSDEYDKNEVYTLAASIEQYSEHPLGKAVVHCHSQTLKAELKTAVNFKMLIARGVSAEIDGSQILAGNEKMLEEVGIVLPDGVCDETALHINRGCAVIYIAAGKTLLGYLVLSDTLREDSTDTIDRISNLGIQPVLLTGDHENAARSIADRLHITEVHADCLPENKLEIIDRFHQSGNLVCMVGDGINDAPALKKAHVGIAMGGVGSDIAVDAADIALVNDDIKALPHLLALSKHMMAVIKCNLTFSMTLNFVAIVLAATGVLNPVVGALVHNAGSVLVIINSAFLLKWRKRK